MSILVVVRVIVLYVSGWVRSFNTTPGTGINLHLTCVYTTCSKQTSDIFKNFLDYLTSEHVLICLRMLTLTLIFIRMISGKYIVSEYDGKIMLYFNTTQCD